ncbi:hypothetical protein DIPPA_34281 [Diplonema papillatum]|nr:hypothetical protein DIPPA_34281 [Diplonema papillatum]
MVRQKLATLLVFCVLPAFAEQQRMLLIDVSSHGAQVVVAKLSDANASAHQLLYPPSAHDDHSRADADVVHVLFHPNDTHPHATRALTVNQPRAFHAHGWSMAEEKFDSATERHKHGGLEVVVPSHVEHVYIDDESAQITYEVPVPSVNDVRSNPDKHRRHARGLSDDITPETIDSSVSMEGGVPVYNPLPRSGPVETQQNFVFLAGGYLASQKQEFQMDLEHIVNILHTSCDGCTDAGSLKPSVPFRRYFTTFNVFAVFQASPEEGATIPSEGVVVEDNLECSYGTVVDRALYCNPSKVIALADTAPCGALGKENVVVITLVNSKKYGGAASYRPTVRVGSFSMKYFNLDDSKEKGRFASLFFHEVGHCYANLMDEYDTTQTESNDRHYPNCAFTMEKAAAQWADWITFDTSLVPGRESYHTIPATALAVCGWSNYFKPSSDCFMEKLTSGGIVPRLCPVCREQEIVTMFSTGMDLANPKCPLTSERLIIDSARGAFLFVNSIIANWKEPTDGGPVVVSWSCGNGKQLNTLQTDQSYLEVTASIHYGCSGGVGKAVEVKATISEQTYWVTKGRAEEAGYKANALQEYVWTVEQVTSIDIYKAAHLGGASEERCIGSKLPSGVQPQNLAAAVLDRMNKGYVSVCSAGPGNCTVQYNTRQYNETAAAKPSAVDDLESLILGVPGILLLVLLLGFLGMWLFMAKNLSYATCKNLFETRYDFWVDSLRKVIMISGICFLCVAVFCIVWGLLAYPEKSAFLKIVLIAGIILAVLLFIMAFVGTTAAYYRARKLLFLNTFGLFCALGVMAYSTYVVIYIANNIATSGCGVTSGEGVGQDTDDEIALVAPCSVEDNDIAICGIEGVNCELRGLWKAVVREFPDKICAFQDELGCSGYVHPCNINPSEDYCPVGCEDINFQYGDGCKVKLQDDIKEECEDLTPIMIILTIVMALAMVNNLLLACLIGSQMKAQREAANRSMQRLQAFKEKQANGSKPGSGNRIFRILNSLDETQKEKLARRFHQVDKDKNGKVDKREFGLFMRAIIAADLTVAELNEAFRSVDSNKNGTIDIHEFVRMFHGSPTNKHAEGKPLINGGPNGTPSNASNFQPKPKQSHGQPNGYAKVSPAPSKLAANPPPRGGVSPSSHPLKPINSGHSTGRSPATAMLDPSKTRSSATNSPHPLGESLI